MTMPETENESATPDALAVAGGDDRPSAGEAPSDVETPVPAEAAPVAEAEAVPENEAAHENEGAAAVASDESEPEAPQPAVDEPAAAVDAAPPRRRELTGIVLSSKADKTITVRVERRVKHPVYGKFIRRSTKLAAHDERNDCKEGDLVTIIETRPISKTKSWRLGSIVERASA